MGRRAIVLAESTSEVGGRESKGTRPLGECSRAELSRSCPCEYTSYDRPLFSERFLTMRYGPMLRSAQEKFDSFAEKAISRFAKDALDNVFVVDEWKGADIVDAIQSVWAKYKAYDGISLSRLLCSPGTAWSKAKVPIMWVNNGEKYPFEISGSLVGVPLELV